MNIRFMKENVKTWYKKTYPTDDEVAYIYDDLIFYDIYFALVRRVDIYEVLGYADSTIRERIFSRLADILQVDYDVIYDMWLES